MDTCALVPGFLALYSCDLVTILRVKEASCLSQAALLECPMSQPAAQTRSVLPTRDQSKHSVLPVFTVRGITPAMDPFQVHGPSLIEFHKSKNSSALRSHLGYTLHFTDGLCPTMKLVQVHMTM
jgi:hypothetical protein